MSNAKGTRRADADKSVRQRCPAKVNLTLAVGGPRSTPRGMLHPIASWMVATEFGDELELAVTTAGHEHLEIAYDKDWPGVVDWPLEKDLAYRAWKLAEQSVGRSLPVRARLCKKIPTGAGLGGGSSDAAAMLVGLNRLHQLELDATRLMGLGAQLGSDVVFLIGACLGCPSATVRGFGEILQRMELREAIHLVLIFPGFGCPTGQVYAAFDELAGTSAVVNEERVTRIAAGVADGSQLFNDLAAAAFVVRPELRQIADDVKRIVDRPVHVTGSGATLFVVAEDATEAAVFAEHLTRHAGVRAVATRTLPENYGMKSNRLST